MRRTPRENSALEIPEAREVLEKESEDHQLSRLVEAVQELPRNAIVRVIRAADGSLFFSSATFADLYREHILREAARIAALDVNAQLQVLTEGEAFATQAHRKKRREIESGIDRVADRVREISPGDYALTLLEHLAQQVRGLGRLGDQERGQEDPLFLAIRTARALLETLDKNERTGEITSMEEALTMSSPLTLNELERYLKRSRASLYRHIAEDGLPAHRLPGRRGFLFYRDEVDAWVKGQGSGNEEGSSAPDPRE